MPSFRGLHAFTFQLNLSRFCHKIHSKHPLIPRNAPYAPPKRPLNAPPIPQKALTLNRKVDECKPLPSFMSDSAISICSSGLYTPTRV